jgi:succinate dehydrogenase / fumarate reductase, membrane anchor subunit
MALQTSIAKVRGLGAAREGTEHFKLQRLTAIANIALVLWFVFSLAALPGSGYEEVRAWLGQPLPAILTILLVISVVYHARLGLQVVIEDYVHHEGVRVASLAALALLAVAIAVACIVAVLKVMLGS